MFLSADGRDLWPEMGSRMGWLGYQLLNDALPLGSDSDYQNALSTMIQELAPTDADYANTLDSIAEGPPEAVPLMAQLAGLFKDYQMVEHKGSFSVTDQGQTIGKIMRKGNGVFVGLRDSDKSLSLVQGAARVGLCPRRPRLFRGLIVPVDNPDAADAAALAGGLGKG